jgi:hypothetical protein
MQQTVLARILEGEWKADGLFNIITLVIMPRQQLYVYANEITKKEFDELKHNASFIVLEKRFDAQLDSIVNVIPPFAETRYKNAV